MLFNFVAGLSINEFKAKWKQLMYRKVYTPKNVDMELFVQARSDLSNMLPRAYTMEKNAHNRLVLVRRKAHFGDEWNNYKEPAAPKKLTSLKLWQKCATRRRITEKAKLARRQLKFDQITEAEVMQKHNCQTKNLRNFAPKKITRCKDVPSSLYKWQSWSQERTLLQRFFKSRRHLKFDPFINEIEEEETSLSKILEESEENSTKRRKVTNNS